MQRYPQKNTVSKNYIGLLFAEIYSFKLLYDVSIKIATIEETYLARARGCKTYL